MKTRTILDYISTVGCSVKTEKYIEDSGQIYTVGQPMRCAYSNSPAGREQLKQDYPQYYTLLTAEIWGDTPTVSDELPEEML